MCVYQYEKKQAGKDGEARKWRRQVLFVRVNGVSSVYVCFTHNVLLFHSDVGWLVVASITLTSPLVLNIFFDLCSLLYMLRTCKLSLDREIKVPSLEVDFLVHALKNVFIIRKKDLKKS